jgi:Ni/Co efflux regulator RcnB
MKMKITTALGALLLAGASTAALAQEHDHGDRGRGQAPAQAQPQAARGAQPQGHWNGGGREGGFRGEGQRGPQGAPGAHEGFRGDMQRAPGFDQRRNFQGQAPVAGAPGPQRFERGAGQVPGPGQADGRRWDHQRGPQEVIPPGGQRGFEGRRDNPAAGGQFDRRDGRWEGRGDDRRHDDAREGHWARGEHWQAGHFPPVFWSQHRFRVGAYRAPYGYYVRSWGFGDFLPRGWYGQDYGIDDFLDYDLPYPPPGYEWVRVGGDALMVDRFTGRIVQVVRGIFW